MKKIYVTAILLAVTFTLAGVSHAVPSRNGMFPGPKDAVRPREVEQVYDAKTKTMRAIRKSGVIKVTVIPVQFPSAGTQTSGSYAVTSQNLLDMAANLVYLKNFYNEAAYGTVDTSLTVVFNGGVQKTAQQITGSETCLTLSHPMSYYGASTGSVEGVNGGQAELIQDAVASAVSAGSVNVSGSNFDTVIVVHAGYGNESTAGGSQTHPANPGDIWSVQVEFGNTPVNGFSYGIVVPMMEYKNDDGSQNSPRGVYCHEFGHYLGLPDMYNTNNGDSAVGYWCLMDEGPWINNGFSPGHPCVWCKNYLGLVSPQVITSSQEVTGIAPEETSASCACQFNVPNSAGEYFLVSFTTNSAYNPISPGTGVLIWHVYEATINGETFADRITNNDMNSYTPLTAALVTSGGENIGSKYRYFGGPGDTWPGARTAFAVPASNAYSGRASGITLSNFQLSASAASFYAAINLNPSSGAAARTPRVYPNPFTPNVHHNLTFDNIDPGANLKIYNVAGELVRGGISDINGIGMVTWDGKNDAGKMAASGIYIARIEGAVNKANVKFAVVK